MGKLMGLDYGSKTVGVALSDSLQVIASPLETIVRERESKMRATFRRLTDLVKNENVELIVVGDPLHLDGSRGERSERSRSFAEELRFRLHLEGIEIPVVLWDERLTTVSADEILEESGVERSERKTYIDKIAAALILEDYMKNAALIQTTTERKE